MLGNIWLALAVTFLLSFAWLRLNDFLAHRGIISGPLSRKIIHTGTGPLFVLCWLLFPDVPAARFAAAAVPLGITAQFFLIGIGLLHDPASVDAMARHGNRRELLRGPLYYGIVFVLLTVLYWTDSPIGMVALMLLCGGDGLADIVGKRVESMRIPWAKNKSLAGSIVMFLGGFVFSMAILGIFTLAGFFPENLGSYAGATALIALVGALVESMPFQDIDNLTVPAAAVLLGHLLF